ncbi:diguanylate cyclase [Marinobacterium sp. AK62]|uniref:Diguanylate cyclase n=1 Tax=Marinobacterium alkalitolerans TaxID=1542925 RepID=A0ABS3ZE83_9GAMM|nr:diguanylate cyclase [Marinobacterium alkalitolerans]MBP0050015.1 diguanylate cyclase [Marinobacterium alkalitolerans]
MKEERTEGAQVDTLPSSRHLLQLADNLDELVIILRLDGTCAWCNTSFARLLGEPREALLGKAYPVAELRELMVTGPREAVESWVRLPDGRSRLIRFRADMGLDDEGCVESLLATGRDLTPFFRLQHPLQVDSHEGLLSASDPQVQARIEHALHRAHRAQEYVGFMAIQLSGAASALREVQQSAMLNRLIDTLRQRIRLGDTLARLDSGAYLLVLEQIDCPEAIATVIDKFSSLLEDETPADIGGFSINAGVSISPDDGLTAPELIDRAQQAMQRALMNDQKVNYF